MYIIYIAINKINQKKYIGQTCRGLKIRMQCHKAQIKIHNNAFHNALRKHGWDNFEWSVLKESLTLDEANYWEEKLIKEHNTCCQDKGHHGYNIKRGGDNYEVGEETKHKIGAFHKGKKLSEEHKQQIGAFHKGKKRSEETKQKISRAHKGKIFSEETRKKISLAHKGRKHSEEAKQNMSLAHKGKKLSEERKNNMSITSKKLWQSSEFRNKVSLGNQKSRVNKILCQYPLVIPFPNSIA